MYLNTGAYIDGQRAASKKALKTALTDNPGSVTFDQTSMVKEGRIGDGSDITGETVPEGVKLAVCGPDPYNNRKWYATVQVGPKGVKLT